LNKSKPAALALCSDIHIWNGHPYWLGNNERRDDCFRDLRG